MHLNLEILIGKQLELRGMLQRMKTMKMRTKKKKRKKRFVFFYLTFFYISKCTVHSSVTLATLNK